MGLFSGLLDTEKEETSVTTTEETRVEELTYLQTLKVREGAKDTGGLQSGPIKEQFNKDINSWIDTAKFISPTVGVYDILFGSGPTERSTSVESSGWKIKEQHVTTKWDRARYAIGIKDIGVWAYQYMEKSGFVSVPYASPKPIRAISLHADEVIPAEFQDNRMQRWIRYWISANDGQNWIEIAPANQGALVDSTEAPQVIHVNSGIPEQERDPNAGYLDVENHVTSIRLKAVLYRPAGVNDATPILKSYRLQMTLRGAL